MATIKSYTDLEQSRKLAEILPIESSDMFIADVFLEEEQTHSYNFHVLTTWGHKNFDELKERENKFVQFIPCWSLAALLEVLKNKIVYGGNDSKSWFVSYTKKNPTKTIFIYKEHLIDACYEAILELNELNLL